MHRSNLLPLAACGLLSLIAGPADAQPPSFITFETGPVRPLALNASGTVLAAVNTPDNQLELFNIKNADPGPPAEPGGITRRSSIPVGLEPCAVAFRADGSEAWVVNHLSDSVSVVDVFTSTVKRTILVGDEPRDIVITDPDGAGPLGERAFITTAHRGQHRTHSSISSVPGAGDPQLTTPSTPRADVWVFDIDDLGTTLGGTPQRIIELFGDTPRALAVSPDGSTVYAAIFHSGNQTAVVNEERVCDGFGTSTCSGDGISSPNGLNNGRLPGGNPGPSTNYAGEPAPEVGLVVQFHEPSGQWRDEQGRNWSNGIRFFLPDYDVFEIDAASMTETASFAHVGTINFNMVVNPNNGNVYVSNTDAQNLTRFEGPGSFGGSTVQGDLHRARITVLDGATVSPVPLNDHINYGVLPAPAGTKNHSLATPTDMVVRSDGSTLYVAAYGSSKVGVISTADLDSGSFMAVNASPNYISVSGGGPGGLALDEANNNLFVLTRFDNSISVVDLNTSTEINHFPLHNPEPASVIAGRPMLYDAFDTSSNGEASCSSCHVFGDFDSLAWDLGDPDGDVTQNVMAINFEVPIVNNLFPGLDTSDLNGTGNIRDFHPMKGPMTTQTLRGMTNSGAMHWRGDRGTGFFQPNNGSDETHSFMNFIVAFPGLVGGTTPPTDQDLQDDMADFTAFALQITLPPNPIRALDNSLTPSQQFGMDFFDGTLGRQSDGGSVFTFTCEGCHEHKPDLGFFGTGKAASFEFESQIFKIPHFRNLYQKVGMFGMPFVPFNLGGYDVSHQGDQVRGTGFLHDGATDTLFRFFTAFVFSNPLGSPNTGFDNNNQAVADQERLDVEQAMLAFDSDLAPIVGQQVTMDDSNFGDTDVNDRLDLLEARAEADFESQILGGMTKECDLVAHGRWNGKVRSALYDPVSQEYELDTIADPGMLSGDPERFLTTTEIRALANNPGHATTFTCVPPGSGHRIALDRDEDGHRNRDERSAGTQPDNPASFPGACNDGMDNDGDGLTDTADPGCPSALATIENPQCDDGFDNDGDGLADFGSDPDCGDPGSDRELAIVTEDCRVGRTRPGQPVAWFALMFLALLVGTRRRRA